MRSYNSFLNCFGYRDLNWASRTFCATRTYAATSKIWNHFLLLKLIVQIFHSIYQAYPWFSWSFFPQKSMISKHMKFTFSFFTKIHVVAVKQSLTVVNWRTVVAGRSVYFWGNRREIWKGPNLLTFTPVLLNQ